MGRYADTVPPAAHAARDEGPARARPLAVGEWPPDRTETRPAAFRAADAWTAGI